jgi:hypothetical protein
MPPVHATIAVTQGSGLLLDAVSLTVGLNTVVRETMVIADPSNATNLATVSSGGALSVSDATIAACITANVLAVSLPTATVTTLTPPSAAAIASAIVANPPTVGISGTIPISGTIAATQSGTWTVGISAAQTIAVTNAGTFAVQATLSAETTKVIGTVNQGTSPWVVSNGGTFAVQAAITAASGSIASGAISSGAIASGAIASGAIAAGAAASGAFADGSVYVRSNAAATFPVTATIAAAQTIAVTNTGTFAVQATLSAETTKVIGTVNQGTSPWIVAGGGTAGTPGTAVLTVQGVAGGTAQPVSIAANVSTVPGLPTTGATTKTNTAFSSSGWTTIVAASGSTTIRLYRLVVSVAAATSIEIGDGTNIFLGPYYLTANGSIVLDISGEPWAVSGAGVALEINSSNAVNGTCTTWTTQS